MECAVEMPTYLAPEILEKKPFDTRGKKNLKIRSNLFVVDVYAYGILLYELMARNMFFSEIQWISDIADKVVAGIRPDLPIWCPAEYAQIINSCWASDPGSRAAWPTIISELTAGMLLKDKWEEEFGPSLKEFVKVQKAKKDAEELKALSGMSHGDEINLKIRSKCCQVSILRLLRHCLTKRI